MYNGQILRVVSIFSSSTLQESEYVYLSKCWTIAFKRTDPIDGQNRCNCFTSILTSICLVLVSMHSSPRGAHSWHFLFLLSGLGRWRLGWHHEQQRAVSCIPVAHLLNFTKKCQKKKKKNPPGRQNSLSVILALILSSVLLKLLMAQQGTKTANLAPAEA